MQGIDELTDEAPVGATIRTGAGTRIDGTGDDGTPGRVGTRPVTVPTDRYISAEFAERERLDLWPRVWQVACSVEHVSRPGDVFEHTVGFLSVIVVRGDDGALRAFQNTCRHRGSELCHGASSDRTELRCPYHRWAWDLTGALREVPSRKGFGALPADEYGLIPVQVGTWGPLVFVNPDVAAPPLEDFLDGVPEDSAWLGLEDFRCTFLVSIPLPCNWKTLIDGFSETYHVQGIHREMLPMVDDVNGPQRLWRHHGKLEQPYGLPSPRLRTAPDVQAQWEGFVDVMGERIGVPDKSVAGPAPEVAAGSTWRSLLAGLVREHQTSRGVDLGACTDEQVMTMQQYNLFPNVTVVAFPDLLSVVRARPGTTPDDCVMDAFVFQRHPAGDPTPRTQPVDVVLPGDSALPIGMVLNQDVENARRAQRGMHQPGCIRLTLSREECRILNLHRNLERWLSISPTEIQWHGPPD